MSPDQPDVTSPETTAPVPDPATAPAAEPVEAPKRPRAPRKTATKAAAQTAADAPAASESTPADAGAVPEVAAAPAPRRRTRKAAEVAEAAEVADTAAEPVAGTREDVPTAMPVEAVGRDEATPVEDDAGSLDPEAGEGAAEADASGDGENRRSRNRRRRRGRRGGAGDDEVSGSVSVEGAAEGEGPGEREAGDLAEGDRPPRAPRPVVEFAEDAGETFAGVLSGAFDADAEVVEGQSAIPAKRVLPAEPDAPKLHKVLAQSGIGSRRDMEQLIADGKVTVNGEVAHTGQRISFGDDVRVAGRVVKLRIAPPPARVIAYHKPAGEVVTMDDPEKRPTVFRRLPRLAHGKWQSVGRLDINTEGLLLFTNSGDLANKLMHPRFGVEREYAVRVLGTLDDESRQKLLEGVSIEGQPAQFKSIEDGGGEGVNHWYRVVITEGRNREVRKLFDAVGLAVSRLIRIRYGSVVLPKGLKRGVWVDLDEGDVRRLRLLAGAEAPRPQQPQQQEQRADRGPRGNAPPPKQRNGRGRDRGERAERGDRSQSPAPVREPGDPSFIPNPLQQTFDRRAIQQRERPIAVDDFDEEGGPVGPIPNPLQQTYDKRFVQGNRSPFGGKSKGGGKGGGGAPKQPDPLQTAVGYIGADAFVKKLHGNRGGRGRR